MLFLLTCTNQTCLFPCWGGNLPLRKLHACTSHKAAVPDQLTCSVVISNPCSWFCSWWKKWAALHKSWLFGDRWESAHLCFWLTRIAAGELWRCVVITMVVKKIVPGPVCDFCSAKDGCKGSLALATVSSTPAEVRPGLHYCFLPTYKPLAATEILLATQLQQACILYQEEDLDWAFKSGQTSLQQDWVPLKWVIPFPEFGWFMLQSSHSIPGSERNRMHRKGLLFLLPLSHLSLTKAVKCFPVHLLCHRIYTWWIKRTRVEKSTCQGSHPLPLLQQPWEQSMLLCHVQPECVTPPKWREEGDTIWRSQFWH